MARRGRIAVYPPHKHRKKWRIEIRDGVSGSRSRPSFGSEKEAWREYRKALKEAEVYQQPTVGELAAEYEQVLKDRDLKPRSVEVTILRLKNIVPSALPVSKLTKGRIEKAYTRRVRKVSPNTQRNELMVTKAFCLWLVKKGYLKTSPAADVEPVGRKRKGKPQLRAGEAMLFLNRALELSAEGDDAAFLAAVCLVMGVRLGEIMYRYVRDVDPAMRVLHIEQAKTPAGNRRVEIPDVLWPHFEARIEGRKPMDILLPSQHSESGFRLRCWAGRHIWGICDELGLPRICAHGLRGTHSTLAQEAGATAHLVAQQLGHTSTSITLQHYTAPGTAERQKRKRALKVLTGGRVGENK